MSRFLIPFFAVIFQIELCYSQMKTTDPPYREIPNAPDQYTPYGLACRMIDGLGFRYYWATEGLTQKDLDFKPSSEARSSRETLDHIFGLSQTILSSAKGITNSYDDVSGWSYEELRQATLSNLKEAADIFRSDPNGDLNQNKIIFSRGDKVTEYPFWNLINGPIEDAAWHIGQIVSFRRSSGNPFNSKASLFSGKLRD